MRKYDSDALARPSVDGISFGARVELLLKDQRRSKVWLAGKIAVSKQNLNYILGQAKGSRRLPEIAAALHAHPYWLEHGVGPRYKSSVRKYIKIPILPLQINHVNNIVTGKIKYLVSHNKLDVACFAITIQNDSMAPDFKQGSYLIFDPNKNLHEGCFVCMSLKHKPGLLFRQFHQEGTDQYFKAFDNMYRVIQNEPYIVHGVLVESRQVF